MSIENEIAATISELFASIQKEQGEAFEAIKDSGFIQRALECIEDLNPDKFHILYSYQLEQRTRGMLQQSIIRSQKAQFLFLHYDFVSNFFRKAVDDNEEPGCVADKTRFLTKSLARFLILGLDYEINFDQKYSFHLPKKVFQKHDDLVSFFDAIHDLFYGQSQKFLKIQLEWTHQGLKI